MAGLSDVVLKIKVVADAKSAVDDLNKAGDAPSKMSKGMAAAGVASAAAIAGIVAYGKAAVDSASRTEQAMGGLEAVFGANADQVKAWSDESATAVGLAKSQYGELATLIGSQLKSTGMPMDQVTSKTNDLIKMGADLSAMYGGTAAEAVAALSSALKGELDPIEAYGVSIKQADVNARMAAEGTDKLTGKALKQAQAAATLALMTEAAADSQGKFAAEQDSAAGSAQVTAAQMEDLKATMGTALLPIVAKVTAAFGAFAAFAQEHSTTFQILVGVILAIAAALVVMNAAMIVAAAAEAAVLWPVLLIVAAVIALIAVIVLVVKHWDDLTAAAKAVGNALKAAWGAIVNAVKAAARGVANAFTAAWAGIRSGATSVANFFKRVWEIAFAAVKAYVRLYATVFKAALTAVRAVASAAANVFKSVWNASIKAIGAAIRAWQNIANGVLNSVRNTVAKIGSAFNGVASAIKGAFAGASTWLFSIGADIVRGLISGIDSLIGWVQSKIEQLANMIPGWAKKKLGIGSPSKVMAKIGEDITAGLVVGIEEGASSVQETSERLATRIAATISKAFAEGMKPPKALKDKALEKFLKKRDKLVRLRTKGALDSLSDEYDALKVSANAHKANADAIAAQTDALNDLISARTDYSASLRENARDYAAITSVEATRRGGWQKMAADMAKRVAAVQRFQKVLADLRAAGLASDVVQTLAEAGVEGGLAQAEAIAAGGPEAVAAFNALQAQLNGAATRLGEDQASAMYDAGIAANQALLNGLLGDQAALDATIAQLVENLKDAIDKALKGATRKTKGKGKGGKSASANVIPFPTVAQYAAPTLATGARSSGSGGQVININVTGAVDPEGTARQIKRILAGHDRRVGVSR